jgi:hypothetical protein
MGFTIVLHSDMATGNLALGVKRPLNGCAEQIEEEEDAMY